VASSPYKVLVLGAGASLAYGFPLGKDLRHRILNIGVQTAKLSGLVRERFEEQDIRLLTKFQESFRSSQLYSIDGFLGKRPSFSDIGKKCIAQILLACEGSKELFSEKDGKDHWYQYLFNHIAQRDWDDLTFDDLAVVTFNYDRSLEHFLYVTLQSAYGKSAADAAKKLKQLRIVHVYGSLCEHLPEEPGYRSCDGKFDMEKVEAAAKGLVVIPEGRVDSETLVTARKWLSNARSICFLGFGFDDMNVDRLAADEACAYYRHLSTGNTARRIVGTCKGMTWLEISSAYGRLTKQSLNKPEQLFHDQNCTQALRETLFLK